MSKLSHTERSEISRKAWRKRKREGGKAKCVFCGKLIFARGVRMNGKPYHKGCAEAKGAGLKPAQVGRNPKGVPKTSKGKCPVCGLPVYRGGEKVKDKWYHGPCYAKAYGPFGRERGDNPIKHKGWKLMEDFSSALHVAPDLEAYKAKMIYQRQYGEGNVRMDIRDTPTGGTWAGVYVRESVLKNPRKISERKRAPRDAFRYFGAEELNPLKRPIVYENDETFRIGDEVKLGKRKGIVVGYSEQTDCVTAAFATNWIPTTVHVSKLEKTGKVRTQDLRRMGDIWRNPSRRWHQERVSQLEKAMPYSKRGEYGRGQYDEAAYAEKPGLPNPRVKCPKCGRIMRRVGVGYYICSGCGTHKSVPTTWFPTTAKNPKLKFGPTGFRPPAKWFAKMAQGTSASHFGRKLKELTTSQRAKVGQIVGGIWAKYTDATRLDILRKYEPSAVRALANPSFLGKRTQMLNCPACGGPNPVSRLNVYLRCNTCGAPLRSVRVRHKH